ncbi:MAG: hypothetical protein P8Y99_06015, partial [Calditrichaceae bacterium]
MKYLKIILIALLMTTLYGQDNQLEDDYIYFGRKEPLSLGTTFSGLGTSTLFVNPANAAYISDNRVSVGGIGSGVGYGYYISWLAPNFGINNAEQETKTDVDSGDTYKKRVLQFNFGIASTDFGIGNQDMSFGIGISINHKSDYLYDEFDKRIVGGSANTIDVGVLLKVKVIAVELAVLDINEPNIKNTDLNYKRGIVVGGRYENRSGLIVSAQGLTGERYANSDFGFNNCVEQSFFEQRLISRLQLTSFYRDSLAVM